MSRRDPFAVTALAVTLILIAASGLSLRLSKNRHHKHRELACAVDIRSYADTSRSLVTGYNYHLLRAFTDEKECSGSIRLARGEENYFDSLRAGAVDILAVPAADTLPGKEFLASVPIDSISRWVVRASDKKLLRDIDGWLKQYLSSEEHDATLEMFMKTYIPSRRARTGRTFSYLSPYDDIIKAHADSIGWDWRLLAAVVWQESQFRINVRSRRGAAGLMQMMPRTADRMEAPDLVDPQQSIRAGAQYLKMIEGYYYKWTSDPQERRKYALAAYNAGHGRIKDCINYALLRGKDVSRWEETASVIPEMNSDEILEVDTVKLGRFKGVETLAYVDSVMEIYGHFRRICP